MTNEDLKEKWKESLRTVEEDKKGIIALLLENQEAMNSGKHPEPSKGFNFVGPDRPINDKCPKCDQQTLVHTGRFMLIRWTGVIKCSECDFSQGLVNYVGNKVFKVEDL